MATEQAHESQADRGDILLIRQRVEARIQGDPSRLQEIQRLVTPKRKGRAPSFFKKDASPQLSLFYPTSQTPEGGEELKDEARDANEACKDGTSLNSTTETPKPSSRRRSFRLSQLIYGASPEARTSRSSLKDGNPRRHSFDSGKLLRRYGSLQRKKEEEAAAAAAADDEGKLPSESPALCAEDDDATANLSTDAPSEVTVDDEFPTQKIKSPSLASSISSFEIDDALKPYRNGVPTGVGGSNTAAVSQRSTRPSKASVRSLSSRLSRTLERRQTTDGVPNSARRRSPPPPRQRAQKRNSPVAFSPRNRRISDSLTGPRLTTVRSPVAANSNKRNVPPPPASPLQRSPATGKSKFFFGSSNNSPSTDSVTPATTSATPIGRQRPNSLSNSNVTDRRAAPASPRSQTTTTTTKSSKPTTPKKIPPPPRRKPKSRFYSTGSTASPRESAKAQSMATTPKASHHPQEEEMAPLPMCIPEESSAAQTAKEETTTTMAPQTANMTSSGGSDYNQVSSPRSQQQSRRLFQGWSRSKRPEVDLEDLVYVCDLGVGFYGSVKKVEWQPKGTQVDQLGSGSFGQAVSKPKKEQFALKIMDRQRFNTRSDEKYIFTERQIMDMIDHPFHVKLINTFKTANRLYMLMEFCAGRDLSYILKEKGKLRRESEKLKAVRARRRKLSPQEEDELDHELALKYRKDSIDPKKAKFYAASMLLALHYMYKHSIIHRDIKPGNVLLGEDGYIKLCDYGFSRILRPGERTASIAGTYAYLAPEQCRNDYYHHSVDIWSWAITLYEFYCGKTPFEAPRTMKDHNNQTMENIQVNPLLYPDDKEIPPTLKNLLSASLSRSDTSERLGHRLEFAKLFAHPYFADVDWKAIESKTAIPP